jgi:hypothetical protein
MAAEYEGEQFARHRSNTGRHIRTESRDGLRLVARESAPMVLGGVVARVVAGAALSRYHGFPARAFQ